MSCTCPAELNTPRDPYCHVHGTPRGQRPTEGCEHCVDDECQHTKGWCPPGAIMVAPSTEVMKAAVEIEPLPTEDIEVVSRSIRDAIPRIPIHMPLTPPRELFNGLDDGVDMVNAPRHYNAHPSGIECILITRDMTFDTGNAFKYVYRSDHKNGRQDLEKAEWYLKDAIEHADVVVLARNLQRWIERLDLVAKSEPDPNRIEFIFCIRQRNLTGALEAVRALLEEG